MDAADLILVTNLLNRYCHLVDTQPIDDVAELFWPDATLVAPDGVAYQGIDAVLGWYREWDTAMRAPVTEMRHRISSPAVTVNGDTATALSYLDADAVTRKGVGGVRGRYVDELARRDGEWRFSSRTIEAWTSPPRDQGPT